MMNTQSTASRDARGTARAIPVEAYNDTSHFGGVALALLPAFLILSTATGLLVAML